MHLNDFILALLPNLLSLGLSRSELLLELGCILEGLIDFGLVLHLHLSHLELMLVLQLLQLGVVLLSEFVCKFLQFDLMLVLLQLQLFLHLLLQHVQVALLVLGLRALTAL